MDEISEARVGIENLITRGISNLFYMSCWQSLQVFSAFAHYLGRHSVSRHPVVCIEKLPLTAKTVNLAHQKFNIIMHFLPPENNLKNEQHIRKINHNSSFFVLSNSICCCCIGVFLGFSTKNK